MAEPTPTDAEIDALWNEAALPDTVTKRVAVRFARAVLARWGAQPAPAASVLEDAARWQALESCVLEINGGDDWMSIVLKDDAKPEDFLKRLLASKLTALAARKQGANHD